MVANRGWMQIFPKAMVHNGFAYVSDHKPIILSLKEQKSGRSSRLNSSFKFEPMWLRDGNFKNVALEAWRDAKGKWINPKGDTQALWKQTSAVE